MKKIIGKVILTVFIAISSFWGMQENTFATGISQETLSEDAEVLASGQCGDDLNWVLTVDGDMTISGAGKMWDFRNDASWYDYHECPWGNYKEQIKRVCFNDGITQIGADAFAECSNLENVIFSDTITYIGAFAFFYCTSLEDFVFPQNLTTIEESAFAYCETLKAVSIPDSVNFLGASSFRYNTNLTYAYIGGKAEEETYIFGSGIFSRCTSLESIMVSPDNSALKSVDGVLFYKAEPMLVQYPSGKKDKIYHIPEGTETILSFAIDNALYLEELIIPEGVLCIGAKDINAGNAITDCPKLKYLILPSTLQIFRGELTADFPSLCYVENKSDIKIPLVNIAGDCCMKWVDESRNPIFELGKGVIYIESLRWESDGLVYYYKGEIDTEYTGIRSDAGQVDIEWLVENGYVTGQYNGLYYENGIWYYIQESARHYDYTGSYEYDGSVWYIENGIVDTDYTGSCLYGDEDMSWCIIKDGKLDTTYTGMYNCKGEWVYINKGRQDRSYLGMAKNQYGVWFINGGILDRTYTGMYVYNGKWIYVNKGKFDTTYTGMAKNQYGWWYMKNGQLDKSYTGMAKNQYGWWYMKNGQLDKSYTGMAKNQYGWWYMKNGKLDTTYTGMAKNQYGWWYMKNGQLDKSYTGMAKNQYGWWYIKKGQLDKSYTGLASNKYGTWYMKNGKLDTTYSSKITFNGKTYTIKNGKVV